MPPNSSQSNFIFPIKFASIRPLQVHPNMFVSIFFGSAALFLLVNARPETMNLMMPGKVTTEQLSNFMHKTMDEIKSEAATNENMKQFVSLFSTKQSLLEQFANKILATNATAANQANALLADMQKGSIVLLNLCEEFRAFMLGLSENDLKEFITIMRTNAQGAGGMMMGSGGGMFNAAGMSNAGGMANAGGMPNVAGMPNAGVPLMAAGGGIPPAYMNGAANANIGSFIASFDFCDVESSAAKYTSMMNSMLASRTANAQVTA